MTQEPIALEPLEHAIELAQAGKKAAARLALLAILQDEPDHANAWMWLAYCSTDKAESSRALREVLRINPENIRARRLVLRLARQAVFERFGRDYAQEKSARRHHRRNRLVFAFFVMVLLAVGVLAGLRALRVDLAPSAIAPAADPTQSAQELCSAQLAELYRTFTARCGGVESGQACLLNPRAAFERSGQAGDFAQAGDRILLRDLAALTLDAYDFENEVWGLALLLPTAHTRALLIGGATLRELDPTLTTFTLNSPAPSPTCAGVPRAGLLWQTSQQTRLRVNGLRLDVIGAVFIEEAGDLLTVHHLDGITEAALRGEVRRLTDGEVLQVALNQAAQPAGALQINPPTSQPLLTDEKAALERLAQTLHFETPWQNTPTTTPTPPMVALEPEVILFSAQRGASWDVFALDSAGRLAQLTQDPSNERHPALAADGRRLVFSSDRGGVDDLYLLDLVSGDLAQLTTNAGNNRYPSWAGADRLVFTSDRGGTPQLWSLRLDDPAAPQLLTTAANGVIQGHLSVDGVLAYSLSDGGIVLVDGENVTLLDDPRASAPAWSPNGALLAYQSTREGGVHIYIYDRERQSSRRLTDAVISGESQPAWDDTGGRIAFVTHYSGAADLLVADGRTGAVQNMAAGGAENPTWGHLRATVLAPDALPSGAWVAVSAAVRSTLYDVDLPLAVGENSTILRLQDGVWGRMDVRTNGTRLTFYGVESLSRSDAWVVGEGGAIYQMRGGAWRAALSPTTTTLYAVRGGWAVGAGGVILRLNAAGTWEEYPSPTTENLRGLYIENADSVWAVGDRQTLLHWDGQGWQRQLQTPPGNLAAMTGLIVGEAGLFQRVGLAWQPVSLAVGGITDLHTFADGTGWAVGLDGALVYGGAGGAWSLQPRPTTSHLYALDFSDPETGWAVGRDGALLLYASEAPPRSAAAPPIPVADASLMGVWRCAVLAGAVFYPYEITLEAAARDGSLLASGVLPTFGYAVVGLTGNLRDTPPDVNGLPDFQNGLQWLTLSETEWLLDAADGRYALGGVLQLRLTPQGVLAGGAFLDGALVAEISQCEQR